MMKRDWLCLLILALAAAGRAENAARLAVATPAATAPEIDGRLDDDCWRGAVFISGLKDNVNWRPLRPLTALAVTYDAEYLYVAIIAEEPAPNQAARQFTADDEPLWRDDSIEMFLDPGRTGRTFRQLLVNLNGARWLGAGERDADGVNSHAQLDASRIRRAIAITENGWTMEIALPLDYFGDDLPAPAAGAIWGFNWRRYHYADRAAGAPVIHGWCILPNMPHRPDLFGGLLFR